MKDTIAKVLEDHIQSARNQRCICGWRPDWTDRRPQELFPEYRQHREHLATEIEQALLPAMTAATLTNATIHPCGDTETYARGHNDGYETAMAQVLATDELRADEWLEERLRQAQEQAWDECEKATHEIRLNAAGTAWEPTKNNPYRPTAETPEKTAQRSNQNQESGPTTQTPQKPENE